MLLSRMSLSVIINREVNNWFQDGTLLYNCSSVTWSLTRNHDTWTRRVFEQYQQSLNKWSLTQFCWFSDFVLLFWPQCINCNNTNADTIQRGYLFGNVHVYKKVNLSWDHQTKENKEETCFVIKKLSSVHHTGSNFFK